MVLFGMQVKTSDDSSRNEKFIAGVLEAQKGLLSGAPVGVAIPAALGAVGSAAGVDRSYVFAFHRDADGTVYGSQRYEWVAPGVEPEIDNPVLQEIPMYEAGYGRWVDHFDRYDLVHGPVSEFPQSEYETLAEQGIQSLVVIPIYVNAALWGFAGFDDCEHPRSWSEPEIDLLLSLSISIGAALVRELYDDSSEYGSAGLSGLLTGYAAIVAGLAESAEEDDHCDCGPTSLTVLRLGLLVRVHEFLQPKFQQDTIDLSYGLRELYEHLVVAVRTRSATLRLRLDVVPVYVNPAVLPSLTMIVTEILASISCGDSEQPPGAAVLKLAPTDHGAEILVVVEDSFGKNMTIPGLLAGSKMLLIRRLADHANAQVSYGNGSVARIRFPAKTQP
ncbi:MAG: GAF domain-containing protein [Spirochaetaceae bacterium]|nr:MAG: GAF domain-containing protein [Spirochaetaceae bacterium]